MTKINKSRLLVPITVIAAGSIVAGAVAVGHTWPDALIAEIVALAVATAYYVVTGRDSDAAAIYGRRSDERQAIVRMNASRLAFVVMICAAFVCAVVTVALDDDYWQADVIGSLGGLAFLLGLAIYPAHDDHSPDEVRGIMDSRRESVSMESADDLTNP
jgi:uncharacterized membrane protein